MGNSVWVFHGQGARFASGVFTSKDLAEVWIRKHKLEGVLIEYPLDTGVYDWVVKRGSFTPAKEHHKSPEFIGRFTSASQQHEHYRKCDDE
ncbi:DUF7710 domain-containing protein [Deinococcus piscis]|nr:hypothetical protein [Deinococcus piscis]